jgi:hypothetical protein
MTTASEGKWKIYRSIFSFAHIVRRWKKENGRTAAALDGDWGPVLASFTHISAGIIYGL